MFFKNKVSYTFKPVVPSYPSITTILEWTKEVPDTTGLDATVVKFVKPQWVFKEVKHDFQKDINSQYCITPKVIATTGIDPNPNKEKMIYQKVPLNNLNATDVRSGSKEIVNAFVLNKANKQTNQELKDFQKTQIDKDAKIKQLQDEINTLKQGGVK